MIPHLFDYQLALFVLVWLFVLLHIPGTKPDPPTRASEAQA